MLSCLCVPICKSAKMEQDAGNYLYNLVGILVHEGLVHEGVSNGGHYYSYIRDRGRNAYQGGDGKSQVDGASGSSSNSNGSGAGFMEGLERGVSAGASSVGSDGVEEVKVEGVVGGWRGRATPDFPPSSVL